MPTRMMLVATSTVRLCQRSTSTPAKRLNTTAGSMKERTSTEPITPDWVRAVISTSSVNMRPFWAVWETSWAIQMRRKPLLASTEPLGSGGPGRPGASTVSTVIGSSRRRGDGQLRQLRPATDEGLDTLLQFPARQHHAPPAGQALDANVRTEPHDAPLQAAARVRLAQAQHILHAEVDGQAHRHLRSTFEVRRSSIRIELTSNLERRTSCF